MANSTLSTFSIIGLTGGIGSGKSYIANGLRERGYMVYDCDKEAKRIINEDPQVRSQLIALLGSETYQGETYNTKHVAEQVFQNPTLLQQLNAIVHPAVRQDILSQQAIGSFLFIESAILFESGFNTLCKATICVTAPEELRIQRAMQRDGASEEQIRRRIVNQTSEAQRCAQASLILQNDGSNTLSSLLDQIESFVSTSF